MLKRRSVFNDCVQPAEPLNNQRAGRCDRPGAKRVTTTSELGGENGKRFRATESGSCGLPA